MPQISRRLRKKCRKSWDFHAPRPGNMPASSVRFGPRRCARRSFSDERPRHRRDRGDRRRPRAAPAPRPATPSGPSRATRRGSTDPAVSEVVRGDAVAGDRPGRGARRRRRRVLPHPLDGDAGGGPTATGFADARPARGRARSPRAARRRACGASCTSAASCPPRRAPSPHLASRLEVEEALLAAAPEAVALRASIVIGARSRSFRFLVRLVERMPVMPLPAWREHRTAPIDARDVIGLPRGRRDDPTSSTAGCRSTSAGPEVMTLREHDRAHPRRAPARPAAARPARCGLTAVASRVAAAIAGEDPALIGPLMGSLGSDLLPRDDRAAALFGVRAARLRRRGRARAARLGGVEELAGADAAPSHLY